MPLNIKDDTTHHLARELATLTGESLTKAVKHAVQDKLKVVKQQRTSSLADELDRIALHCASLPQKGNSTSDEILGYDENGLPS